MEIRRLRAFVEVVRQGGFSEAAKVVFTTQSAVSKAVRQLEEELGVPLLNRIGHRSTLTDAGEIVYRRALAILAQRDDLVAELGELRGLNRGVLRLGLPPIGNDALFAPLFAVFRGRYPGIDIHLVEQGARRIEEMVLAGEIDLGTSLLPVPDLFEWQAVRNEPMHVVLPVNHPFAKAGGVSLAALGDMPFILFEAGFALNDIILGACQVAGVTPTIAARSGQLSFIVELVGAGLGVAFLPRLIAEQRMRPGVTHTLLIDPPIDWHMALIWRRGGYLPPAARAWLDLAREAAE